MHSPYMEDPKRQGLRLVIQYIRESSSARSSYRLIGYSDRHTYRAVNLDSLDELLSLLRTALPELDTGRIAKGKPSETSILFADVMELSDVQLLALGFRDDGVATCWRTETLVQRLSQVHEAVIQLR